MPTRKKVVARKCSQEHVSPRFCRQQKKVTVIGEKKVNELITSAKNQKSGDFLPSIFLNLASELNILDTECIV